MDRPTTDQVCAMAALLSTPMRLKIVGLLRERPRIVSDLVEALGESQATVSKQLAILREAGVLACRPDGRCREYALACPDRAGAALDALAALAVASAAQAADCRSRRAARMTA